MSTNPGNAIGTNGAYDGRTSVNAFNDVLGVFNGRGILSGWALQPSSGMTITAGGDGSTRDVAIAEDNIGNKTTINNISEAPVPVTISAAPVSNSRIDLVVAYVDNPPQGTSTVTDNYGACGLITVEGTAASTPTAPTEADIRTAITADGGAGTVAYYVVLGSVTVASGTTDIDSSMITSGAMAGITSQNIDFTTFSTSDKVVGTWYNGKPIHQTVLTNLSFSIAAGSNSLSTQINNLNVDEVIPGGLNFNFQKGSIRFTDPFYSAANNYLFCFYQNNYIQIRHGSDTAYTMTGTIIITYTKTTD